MQTPRRRQLIGTSAPRRREACNLLASFLSSVVYSGRRKMTYLFCFAYNLIPFQNGICTVFVVSNQEERRLIVTQRAMRRAITN